MEKRKIREKKRKKEEKRVAFLSAPTVDRSEAQAGQAVHRLPEHPWHWLTHCIRPGEGGSRLSCGCLWFDTKTLLFTG